MSSKSLVQAQFGANAEKYVTSKPHAKGASLQRLVELVKPENHWQALDIATGAGHTALAFAPHVASVVASDITPEMLEQAGKLASSEGLGNVVTREADAEKLPFPDQAFDLVTCRIAPHHFGDVPTFLSEVVRVLRPGGTFALVDNVSPDDDTTPGHSRADLRDAAFAYNAFEKVRDPSHGRALTTAEWVELFEDVGLAVRHKEHMAKAMEFKPWCETMNVPAGTVPQLEAMLREAKPALRSFLEPREEAGKLMFTLAELVLIGGKDP